MTEGNSKKRNIPIFDYLVRVMNNHAGLTLTRPTGSVLVLTISLKLQCGIRLKPTSLDSLDSSETLDEGPLYFLREA